MVELRTGWTEKTVENSIVNVYPVMLETLGVNTMNLNRMLFVASLRYV